MRRKSRGTVAARQKLLKSTWRRCVVSSPVPSVAYLFRSRYWTCALFSSFFLLPHIIRHSSISRHVVCVLSRTSARTYACGRRRECSPTCTRSKGRSSDATGTYTQSGLSAPRSPRCVILGLPVGLLSPHLPRCWSILVLFCCACFIHLSLRLPTRL